LRVRALLALVIHGDELLDLVIAVVAPAGAVLDVGMVVLPACWFCR
jgi:hypothetical protein